MQKEEQETDEEREKDGEKGKELVDSTRKRRISIDYNSRDGGRRGGEREREKWEGEWLIFFEERQIKIINKTKTV